MIEDDIKWDIFPEPSKKTTVVRGSIGLLPPVQRVVFDYEREQADNPDEPIENAKRDITKILMAGNQEGC